VAKSNKVPAIGLFEEVKVILWGFGAEIVQKPLSIIYPLLLDVCKLIYEEE
jgi:hypothetical protein